MAASLRNVASLILAVTILQLAGGLLNVLIPLAMAADQLGATSVGFLGAMYFVGFMAGAWFSPALLAQVGNIRVYAGCAAFASIAVLGAWWADGPVGWAIVRLAQGFAIATLFAAVESWLNTSVATKDRGGVMGFYLVCTKLPLALGPFLFVGYGTAAPESYMIAAMCLALSLAPICFTKSVAPEPPPSQPLAIRAQYEAAPAAVTAAFAAGLTNSSVLFFAPLYAQDRFGDAGAAEFIAAGWIGSLILQYPAGKISDVLDRRLVIGILSGAAALCALALGLLGATLPFLLAAGLFALWGATGLSFYGIAVAHMADRSEPGQLARATSGLLFVWAFGSLIGPILAGVLVEGFGATAVFWFAGVGGAALTALMAWRRAARAPAEVKEPFRNQPATSPAVASLALGEDGKGK